MIREELITEVHIAFKDVKLEDGVGLWEGKGLDDYADEKVRLELRKKDERNNWNQISSDTLNQCHCSLSYFDAKGMKFHLPAFMVASIMGVYKFDLVFTLINLSDYQTQFVFLSQKQKEVVKLFLEYLIESPEYKSEVSDIKIAIKNYWSK